MRKIHLVLAACCAAQAALAAAQEPPSELDELIPESAVEDPEGWAAEGVQDDPDDDQSPVVEAEPSPADAPEVAQNAQPLEFESSDADLAGLPDIVIPLDVPVPEPLAPDPKVEALAQIDAPDLLEALDLAEVPISNELVLAFPIDPEAFPEQEQFVARFAALSNIQALESDEDTIPQLAARARADEELLVETLRTYGYYDAEVIRQLSGGRRNQPRVGSDVESDPRVRFDIIPGPLYTFGAIDLGAFDALGDEDLRKAFGIFPGDPLYADEIVTERARLGLELGENGFPFAELDEPELLIDHARIEGDLTMKVSPNGRYVFGEVVSDQPEFLSGKHLGRIARFRPGDTYQRSLETDLRRAILATGLVSAVNIEPRSATPPNGDEPGEVALDVSLEPAPLRTIAGAIGYGTEEGARVEVSWEHRNLFPPEGALRLRGVFGTREQLGSVSFRRNNFLARDQILTFEGYASDITTEAVEARTFGLRGTFEKVSNLLFQKPLSWAAGAEILYTDERNRVIGGIPRPRQTYTIGSVFGSVTWDSSDDLLDPTEGFRVSLFAAPEVSDSIGTQTFYLRSRADASFYRSVGSTVLAGRVRVASNIGAEPFEIAPSRRLYAGGGGSVRGYGFQAIGPLNDLGEPTGGGSLVEVAVEARIQTGFLDGAVEVVPFFDAGSVSLGSTPDFRFIQYGAGVGVRYKTTFGPIRVDVGAPLNPRQFDSPVVVYVSLGQAF